MGKVRRWMLILCAIFMVFGAQSVYADDTQDSLDGYWSKDENQETEDGETVYRYFLWDGTMITDQWAKIEEEWYFFDANGVMQRGWLWKSGGWYYLDEETGAMQKGWIKIEKDEYFLSESSGRMKTGWTHWKKKWYYLESNGKLATKLLIKREKQSWFYAKTEPFFEGMNRLYSQSLAAFLRKRWIALPFTLVTMCLIGILWNVVPAEMAPLDISRQLHRSDRDHIGGRQPEHRRKMLRASQDLHQASCHLSLKPWPRHEAQVIDQSRHCDQRQNLPFCPEIHHDLIWAKIFLFHCCSFLKSYKLFQVTDFSLKQLLPECLFLFLLQFLQKYLFSAPDPEFRILFIITAAFKIPASNSSIFYILFFIHLYSLHPLPYASPLTPLHLIIQTGSLNKISRAFPHFSSAHIHTPHSPPSTSKCYVIE